MRSLKIGRWQFDENEGDNGETGGKGHEKQGSGQHCLPKSDKRKCFRQQMAHRDKLCKERSCCRFLLFRTAH